MKRTIHLTLLALMFCINGYSKEENNLLPVARVITALQSQNENFHVVNLFHSAELRTVESIGDFIHSIIDQNELQKLFKANYKSVKLVVPVSGSTSINLLLTQHKILTDDFKVKIMDETGEHEVAFNQGIFYYGIIEGYQAKSLVALSVFENEIACVISDQNGNWNLGPLEGRVNEYAYYNDKSFKLPITFSCGTIDSDSMKSHQGTEHEKSTAGVSKCVEIFFDTDYDFYLLKSSDFNAVMRYVYSIFNVESTIYGNEGINIAMSTVVVWTVPDPFNNGSAEDRLNDYSAYRQDGFGADLAQLLAADAGGLGGLAWVEKLCIGYLDLIFWKVGPESYCDIDGIFTIGQLTFPTYTWDVSVASHELGHNLGSKHTHWCGWSGGAIDNCNQCWSSPTIPFEGSCTSAPNPPSTGGTIMSYCHGCPENIDFTAGFGLQPGNKIRDVIANGGCVYSCTSDCLESINVANPVYSGDTAEYISFYFIYGNNLVQSGANVSFRADTVFLKPGFHAETGSVFRAYIDPCTGARPLMASVDTQPSELKKSEDIQHAGKIEIAPNPFNNNMKVSFVQKTSLPVKIVLFNAIGNKIATWADYESMATGIHELSFATDNLSSGIYFLNIYFDGQSHNRKIVKMN